MEPILHFDREDTVWVVLDHTATPDISHDVEDSLAVNGQSSCGSPLLSQRPRPDGLSGSDDRGETERRHLIILFTALFAKWSESNIVKLLDRVRPEFSPPTGRTARFGTFSVQASFS